MGLAYPLTLVGPAVHTAEEIEHLWHSGSKFKIYQGPYCTIDDVLKMRMAGATAVKLIYMDLNERPQCKEIAL
jgi:hypothetical protein